jgi:hypothetical protein
MKNGTFKLAYEDKEAFEQINRGTKKVDKSMLPTFAINEFEKKNFSDPNHNIFF